MTLGLANDQLGYLISPAAYVPIIAAQVPVNDNIIFNVVADDRRPRRLRQHQAGRHAGPEGDRPGDLCAVRRAGQPGRPDRSACPSAGWSFPERSGQVAAHQAVAGGARVQAVGGQERAVGELAVVQLADVPQPSARGDAGQDGVGPLVPPSGYAGRREPTDEDDPRLRLPLLDVVDGAKRGVAQRGERPVVGVVGAALEDDDVVRRAQVAVGPEPLEVGPPSAGTGCVAGARRSRRRRRSTPVRLAAVWTCTGRTGRAPVPTIRLSPKNSAFTFGPAGPSAEPVPLRRAKESTSSTNAAQRRRRPPMRSPMRRVCAVRAGGGAEPRSCRQAVTRPTRRAASKRPACQLSFCTWNAPFWT